MREKELEKGPLGSRYMSPLVKQDLARLERDGDSRRTAMSSLKSFVENMDAGSMPRFLAQVSEHREQGQSRFYAISLYEDVARVHGKLIVPHLPRVMMTLTKSLSSSGSSPQLHQACAKVVTAVAKYSIDEGSSALGDTIIRALCEPLLDLIAGKLEPLAAGAAVCLQALVESDKWIYASDDVVNEACVRTAVALGEKVTRSVAHMQLACSLATKNPSFVKIYGVGLLRASVDIVRTATLSGMWQPRASAVRLLQTVLPIVDSATLASELASTMQTLESCKQDRNPGVRTAATDALKVARTLSLDESLFRSSDDGTTLRRIASLASLSTDDNLERRLSSRVRRLWDSSDDSVSPASKDGSFPPTLSPESHIVSFSPSVSSETTTSAGKQRRSPLFRTKPHSKGASSVSSVEAFDSYTPVVISFKSVAKENVPSRSVDANAAARCESIDSTVATPGRVGKYVRPRPATPGSCIPFPPANVGADQQSVDIESSVLVVSQSRGGKTRYPVEDNSVIENIREAHGSSLVEDEDILSSDAATVDIEMESGTGSTWEYSPGAQSVSDRLSLEPTRSAAFVKHKALEGPAMKYVYDLKGSPIGTAVQCPSKMEAMSSAYLVVAPDTCRDAPDDTCKLHARYNSLAHLSNLESPLSAQKSKLLVTAEDFLPLSTPRRLVRTLQSISADSGSVVELPDIQSCGDGEADMELETSSEAGWSVRDNPIASDDSFKTDSEEEDNGGSNKVQKKTMINSPSQDSPTRPLLDGSNPNLAASYLNKTKDIASGPISSKACDSPSLSPGSDRNLQRPAEDVHSKKDAEQEGSAIAPTSRARQQSQVLEADSVTSRHGNDPEKHPSKLGGKPLHQGEENLMVNPTITPECVFSEKPKNEKKWFRSLSSTLSKRWSSVRIYAEVLLGGSMLVMLAFPVALAMSKAFFTRYEYPGLVPT